MNTKKYLFPLAAILLLSSSAAYGAGFQLKEQGASLQGLSFAGATAKADDLSTIFFNPAGMTRLSGDQVQLNISAITPSAELSLSGVSQATLSTNPNPGVSDGNGGDAGGLAVVPSLYAMWDLSPKLKFGLSVNTPYGLSTSYDDGWAGRYYALDSSVKTITVSPNIAYKVDDKLSLGAGLQFQQIEARLTNAVNVDAFIPTAPDGEVEVEGDDFGYGFTLGALYEFTPETRLGLSYRSRIHHNLKGDIKFTGVPGALTANPLFADADVTAKVTTPDILSLGFYHQLNPKVAILAEAAWTNWSVFDDLTVANESDGTIRQSVDENWNDTYFIALGTEIKFDEKNTFQLGVAYDKSAVDDTHRTFRIPETNRLWVSTGWHHKLSDKATLSVGYSHLFADDATVTESSNPLTNGVVSGTFKSHVDILAVNVTWKF